jgi:uncharacterized membrane protein YuzA (DUF378 family)
VRTILDAAKVATAVTALTVLVIGILSATVFTLSKVLGSTGLPENAAFIVVAFGAGWVLIFVLEWRETR